MKGLIDCLTCAEYRHVSVNGPDHCNLVARGHIEGDGLWGAYPRDLKIVSCDGLIWYGACPYHSARAYRALVKAQFAHNL